MRWVVEEGYVLMHELLETQTAHVHDQDMLDTLPTAAGKNGSYASSDTKKHKPQRVTVNTRLHLGFIWVVEVGQRVGHEHS